MPSARGDTYLQGGRGGVLFFKGGVPVLVWEAPLCIEGVPVLTAECSYYAKRRALMYGVPPTSQLTRELRKARAELRQSWQTSQ